MRSLREYKQVTREPTQTEALAIKSSVESLKHRHKSKMVGYLIQTALFCIVSAILINAVSDNIATWFNVVLKVFVACMTLYMLYDGLSRHVHMTSSLNKVMQGEYRVANGIVKSFTGVRFGHCVIEGEIGDTNKAIVQFDIGSEMVETEDADGKFLCFMTSMQTYVLATLPGGGKLVTDDVDVYELETVSFNE